MNVMVKALIKENVKERKLPGPIGVGAIGAAKIGVVGIVGHAAVLGSSGISVAAMMTCKVIIRIY